MAEAVRFGIIGCAEIARKLCRAIRLAPNAELVAVASRTLEKAQRFKVDNALPDSVRPHGTYEALLDDPTVDAVYLPLPTTLHLHWAVAVARKGKHLLIEKPTALNAGELAEILRACEENGVQFMDGTMWMHHPRTAKMKELLEDPNRFGELRMVQSVFSISTNENFLANNIRVKGDLDSLGSLGDVGWYCIRSILWAANYQLPKTATAFPNAVTNEAGVPLSCGALLLWDDGKGATFTCSFLASMTMQLSAVGSRGTLHLSDFVIPFEEKSASFSFASDAWFTDLVTGWTPRPSDHVVYNELPQEALMVQEFSRLVTNIRKHGARPDEKWPTLSKKTQLVLDAVKASIDKGFVPVQIADA